MRWIVLGLAGCLYVACIANAADRVGNGVEAEASLQTPTAPPSPPVAVGAKNEPAVPVNVALQSVKVEPEPVKPSSVAPLNPLPKPEPDPLRQAAPVEAPKAPAFADLPLKTAPMEPASNLPLATMPGPGDAPAAARPENVAGDLPGSVSAQRVSPFHVEMEDFTIEGNPGPKAQKTMQGVAELKRLVGQISRDLDAGGTERTRLVFNAESIAKEVSVLAELWSDVPPLVSSCVNAKRTALVLVEELRNEPRQWSHVRWAFQDCQKQVKSLRQAAARLAGSQPQLVRVEKKGKVYLVEPTTQDPAQSKLAEEEQKRQALRDERDLHRERAQEIKDTKERIPVNYEK